MLGWISAALVALAGAGLAHVQSTDRTAAADTAIEAVSINDNRRQAGTVDRGTLTIHLEARNGEWHPEGDADQSVVVRAFAVDGGRLQVPAPLIRVVEGTEVHVFIRNRLDEPLFVHGMYARPATSAGSTEPVLVPAGDVRDIRFAAGAPGSYFYWAASSRDTPLARREKKDSQLSGAFIVDALGTPPADRIMLITSFVDPRTVDARQVPDPRFMINGKSWPHTERLGYNVDDTVRIRVLNVGGGGHPMHLHGFYFRVDSRGSETSDTVYPANASSQWANTERLPPGQTFSLTWTPTRPGNWLFHCHDTVHIVRQPNPLDARSAPLASADHTVNHALEMMSGPVMGITVHPTGAPAVVSDATTRRQLRLVARVDSGGTPTEPAYGFSLEERGQAIPPAPPYVTGPVILLKRGEPVSIVVENRLPEATAIHWHGIELDSYYDGVAGFAGDAGRIAPAIPPGGSFEARFTPPRSGTFIYHTHIDEVRQHQAGLVGPLIVVDSPEAYDPSHDLSMLVTAPRRSADTEIVLLNGTSKPAAKEFRAGDHYRLRFINMHTFRPNMFMRMLRDNKILEWRALAKDGMDLAADQAAIRPSEVQMGNGETYDFDFTPASPGEYMFEVRGNGGLLLVAMPIHVRGG